MCKFDGRVCVCACVMLCLCYVIYVDAHGTCTSKSEDVSMYMHMLIRFLDRFHYAHGIHVVVDSCASTSVLEVWVHSSPAQRGPMLASWPVRVMLARKP